MWFLRAFVVMIVCIIFLWFAFWNVEKKVTVKMIPDGRLLSDVPLIFALLVAFVVGMLTWFIVSLFQDFRLRHELRCARRESDRLRDELKALRNLPMKDLGEAEEFAEVDDTLQ